MAARRNCHRNSLGRAVARFRTAQFAPAAALRSHGRRVRPVGLWRERARTAAAILAYRERPGGRTAPKAKRGEHLSRRSMRLHHAVSALSLLATLPACAAGRDEKPTGKPGGIGTKATAANGEVVAELGKSALYVFHAKNGDYWFGGNDR